MHCTQLLVLCTHNSIWKATGMELKRLLLPIQFHLIAVSVKDTATESWKAMRRLSAVHVLLSDSLQYSSLFGVSAFKRSQSTGSYSKLRYISRCFDSPQTCGPTWVVFAHGRRVGTHSNGKQSKGHVQLRQGDDIQCWFWYQRFRRQSWNFHHTNNMHLNKQRKTIQDKNTEKLSRFIFVPYFKYISFDCKKHAYYTQQYVNLFLLHN